MEIELRGVTVQELTPITVVFEDAVFFLSDICLQAKRECADHISDATCEAKSDLMTKLQDERLKYSPNFFEGYFHFNVYLIPLGGTIDVIASGFRLESQGGRG